MHIGLIGGIGPAATDYYYRALIADLAERQTPLDVTIVHADTPTLIANLRADDGDAQVEIYRLLSNRLRSAGAQEMAVTSIAGHFCIDAFKAVSPLPVIDLLETVEQWIARSGMRKVGILGTRTVMESRFYGSVRSADVIPPEGSDLAAVDEAYVAMAVSGSITDDQRDIFHNAGRRMVEEQSAEAVMLGGTDLVLAFDGTDCGFEVIDCAAVHVEAIAARAAV